MKRSRHYRIFSLLLVSVLFFTGRAVPTRAAETGSVSIYPAVYTGLLEEFVDEAGWVDYAGLKARGGARMDDLLRGLEAADPDAMERQEKIAFYINAYNLLTLKLIMDHYPVASIRKISGLSGVAGKGQWTKKLWTLNGEKVSLDQIEHEFLRPMGEPRIHFALVCAARSCPPLARRAYTADTLHDMLEAQARRFNQSPRGLKTRMEKGLFRDKPVLELSSIYKWFEQDFLGVSESLTTYVIPFASNGDRAFIEKHRENLRVRFLDYSWKLNDHP